MNLLKYGDCSLICNTLIRTVDFKNSFSLRNGFKNCSRDKQLQMFLCLMLWGSKIWLVRLKCHHCRCKFCGQTNARIFDNSARTNVCAVRKDAGFMEISFKRPETFTPYSVHLAIVVYVWGKVTGKRPPPSQNGRLS